MDEPLPSGEPGARARFSVDERRAQLLELGLRLFGDRSYDDVSIDDIAREAGVSKGLLYHYFGSKRVFYAACVEHAAASLLLANGADLRTVMEVLGHSSIALTANTYAHVGNAAMKDAAAKLDSAIGGASR